MSQAGKFGTGGGGGGTLNTLTGNTGVATAAGGNINVIGNGVNFSTTGSGDDLTITAAAASTTVAGIIEIATNAETIAGTDTDRAVTPDDLKAKLGVQTSHGVMIGAGTSAALTATAAGTANQVLQSGGASADPVWSTATYPATTAQGDIIYSSAANTITSLTKDTNATRYLSNTGSSNNPAWAQVDVTNGITGVVPIANGGTNASSMATTYGVNYFDGTRLVTTAVGTAGDVLTSNGAGVAPTFQAPAGGGVTSIAGTANQITASAPTGAVTLSIPSTFIAPGSIEATTTITADTYFKLPTTTSTAGHIQVNSVDVYHAYGTNNQFWGAGAGNFTLTTGSAVKNVSLGDACLASLTTAAHSVALGYNALNAHTAGDGCIAIGSGAADSVASAGGIIAIGNDALTAQTSVNTTDQRYGSIAIGWSAGGQLTTGRGNILLGHKAGFAYTSSEQFNICIGTSTGSASDSHVIRIGADGSGDHQQDTCYIAGIYNHGTSDSSSAIPVINSDGKFVSNSGTLTTAQTAVNLKNYVANANASTLNIQKTRSNGVITSGDGLGNIVFAGHDGTSIVTASQITSTNSGTIATNRIASDLKFYTHPDSTTASTLRMTIAPTGAVTIAAPDSGTGLTVSGGGTTITAGGLTVSAGDTTLVDTYGKTVGATTSAVIIDSTGLLGTIVSSERFKENIEDMADDSSALMELRPVTFSYKKDVHATTQYGLIAEEVYEHLPNLVNLDDEGIPFSVKYHDLPALLLNELQKLERRVHNLERELKKARKG